MTALSIIDEPLAASPNLQASTMWQASVRRFAANRSALVGLILVFLIIMMALFAPFIAPAPYDQVDLAATLQFPSRDHPLGTDEIGRDVFSRLVYGARTSLLVGIAAATLSVFIGVPLGAYAGWKGGWVDTIVQRLLELMTAIPGLLVALLLVSLYGGGLFNIIVFIGFFGWVTACRLARAQFVAIRERDYITAAHALGIPERRIMVRHVLPNAIGPMLVGFMLAIPAAMFAEAGLSFLGMGIRDPVPSWGKMIGDAGGYIQSYWFLALSPTIFLAVTIISFNFVGDGLRDAFDPTRER